VIFAVFLTKKMEEEKEEMGEGEGRGRGGLIARL